jgi:hypothetical protein
MTKENDWSLSVLSFVLFVKTTVVHRGCYTKTPRCCCVGGTVARVLLRFFVVAIRCLVIVLIPIKTSRQSRTETRQNALVFHCIFYR